MRMGKYKGRGDDQEPKLPMIERERHGVRREGHKEEREGEDIRKREREREDERKRNKRRVEEGEIVRGRERGRVPCGLQDHFW
jgi:hypothetical protein